MWPYNHVDDNPNNGSFKIKSEGAIIQLIDIFGKILVTEKTTGDVVDISANVSPGMYFVKLTFENGKTQTKKIVVEK